VWWSSSWRTRPSTWSSEDVEVLDVELEDIEVT
jgi:hypothetical protein